MGKRVVTCPGCASGVRAKGKKRRKLCPVCGTELEPSVYDEAEEAGTGDPVRLFGWPDLPYCQSSSGRHPGTTPAERTLYLNSIEGRSWDALAPGALPGAMLAEQERLVELAQSDLEDATSRWRNARSDSPELGERRSLSPEDRHAWVVRMQAEAAHEAALSRYEQERDRLFRMLDRWEQATAPVPREAISDPYADDRL